MSTVVNDAPESVFEQKLVEDSKIPNSAEKKSSSNDQMKRVDDVLSEFDTILADNNDKPNNTENDNNL